METSPAALLAQRRALRRDFGLWCEHALAPQGFVPAAHHRLLIRELQAERGGCGKVRASGSVALCDAGSTLLRKCHKSRKRWQLPANHGLVTSNINHLPRLSEPGVEQQRGRIMPHSAKNQMRILVVEDEPLIRMLICELLEGEGFGCADAGSAEDALAMLDEGRGWQPAVLVTDLNLGLGLDGIELAREVRLRRPGIRVVYVTANPDRVAAVCNGECEAVVAKPFNADGLVAVVTALAVRKNIMLTAAA